MEVFELRTTKPKDHTVTNISVLFSSILQQVHNIEQYIKLT